MYIPKTPNARTEFILSCCSLFFLGLSGLYFLLLVWNYLHLGSEYHGLSPVVGGLVVVLSYVAYSLNRRKYTNFSLLVLITTLLTICTLTGIWWGFNISSVLLGYIMSIVIMSTVANRRQNIIHLVCICTLIAVGYTYRVHVAENPIVYQKTETTLDDVFEFYIIFAFITGVLLLSNREQQKLLDRSRRSEGMLKKERDNLESIVEQRTKEIKQLQMDYIGEMYRFVEFGKLSSGLFHDLMSPIQTLKIYIESFKQKESTPEVTRQFSLIEKVAHKVEDMLHTMRSQIKIDSNIETFDVLSDIRDLIIMTRYIHLKHHIDVEVVCDAEMFAVTTKRTILNHILLNLISNACEACIPVTDERECRVVIRIGRNTDKKLRNYISIEDTGVGISTDNLQKIFDPFFSTKQSVGEAINCGIGLSSAKHAIQKHLGGKLFVESDEGTGTTMTILF